MCYNRFKMVRNYKKKTDRGSYTPEIINAALVAVREGCSVRKASMDFNIPRRTLNNYWSKFRSLNNPLQPVPASDVIPPPSVSQPETPPLEELLPETSVPLVQPESPVPDLPQSEGTLSEVPPLAIPPPNMLPIGYAKTWRVSTYPLSSRSTNVLGRLYSYFFK